MMKDYEKSLLYEKKSSHKTMRKPVVGSWLSGLLSAPCEKVIKLS